MGQRHQFFVIARVVPHSANGERKEPRYRCIAALHHQWMYGPLLKSPVLHFIELCRNTYNARAIEAELASIEGRFGAYGQEEPKIDDTPCPYISQILCISAYLRSGPMVPYTSNLFPARYGSGEYDNDDGITIFDVTDPSHCRYGHVFLSYGEGTQRLKPNPISFLEYLRSYGEEPTNDETTAFERLRLISPEALVEAWPWEYAILNPDPDPKGDIGQAIELSTIPSLSSMAHKQLLPLLHANNQLDLLPDVVLDDSMKSHERRHLLGRPIRGADLALLHHVLLRDANINEDLLDLSGLNITVEDITNLDIDKRKIRYMDLSSTSAFSPTTEDLVKLGTNFPLLEWLNLLNCSNVDVENIKGYFARNGATYQIIHPKLITFPQRRDAPGYVPTPVYGSQFSVIIHTFDPMAVYQNNAKTQNRWIGASVRFFNLAPALQAIHDVVCRYARHEAPIIDQYDTFAIEFTAYLTSGSHLSKSTWSARPFLGLPDKVFKFKANDLYRTEAQLMTPKNFTAWTFILHEDYVPDDRTKSREDQPQPNLEYSFVRFEDCKAVEICDLDGFLKRNRQLEGAMERQLVDNLHQVLSNTGPPPAFYSCDVRPSDGYSIQRALSVLPESKSQAIADELFSADLEEDKPRLRMF